MSTRTRSALNLHRREWRAALLGAMLVASITHAKADTWLPLGQEQIVGNSGNHAGASVAVHTFVDTGGSNIVRVFVGMPDASHNAVTGAGAVAVLTSVGQGWSRSTLYSPDPQANAHFGTSVAFSNGHLLVGSPDYDDVSVVGSGRVDFFFDGTTDTPNITSQGKQTSTGGNLGSVVAVDGDMAVSAKLNARSGNGCIVTYRFNTGTQSWYAFPTQATALRCGSTAAALGSSLAIRQTGSSTFNLVAGAPFESQNGNSLAGAAHVYITSTTQTTGGGLLEVSALAAPSPTGFDFFGTSVGIDAGFVYVGGSGRDNGVGRVGSVTIFKAVTPPTIGFSFLGEYFPSDPATIGGRCGAALSLDPVNDQFIMGCPNSTGSVVGEGTARVYQQYEFAGQPIWLDSVLSFGSHAHGADALGTSVAISGDFAFVGAPNAGSEPGDDNGGFQEFALDAIFKNGFE